MGCSVTVQRQAVRGGEKKKIEGTGEREKNSRRHVELEGEKPVFNPENERGGEAARRLEKTFFHWHPRGNEERVKRMMTRKTKSVEVKIRNLKKNEEENVGPDERG